MKDYQINWNHFFEKMVQAYLFLVRARCTCGWESRACFRLNNASGKYYLHALEKANE